jgi:phosphoglycerate kinase
LAKAERKGVKIHLPKDFLCGQDLKSSEGKYFTEKTGIPDGMMGLDCGEIT